MKIKVTKNTGIIGGIIIGITTLLFLAYWAFLLEPLQADILDGKVELNKPLMLVIAGLVGVFLNTFWMVGTKLIGGRQFDWEYIELNGIFKSKAYWQMTAVVSGIMMIFTAFWFLNF